MTITKKEMTKKQMKNASERAPRKTIRTSPSLAEALAEQLERILQQQANANRRNVADQYPISCICQDIRDNADGKYGKTPIKAALEKLGWERAWFYKLARVADAWLTEESIKADAERVNSRGIPLSWSHFVELAGIKDDEPRESILREALDKAMSLQELKGRIKAEQQEEQAEDESDDVDEACSEGEEDEGDCADDEHDDVEDDGNGDDEDPDAEDVERDDLEDADSDAESDAGSGEQASSDADAIEAALAYLESGSLDGGKEMVALANLEVAAHGLTAGQFQRLEAIVEDANDKWHLLGSRCEVVGRIAEQWALDDDEDELVD